MKLEEKNTFIGYLEDITGTIITISKKEEIGIKVISLRCTNENILNNLKQYIKVGDLIGATFDNEYNIEKVSFIAYEGRN